MRILGRSQTARCIKMRKYRVISRKQVAESGGILTENAIRDMTRLKIPHQKVAGTYVFRFPVGYGEEIEKMYSVNGAAEYLNIDQRRIRALAANGDLDYDIIETLGKQGWAMIFLEQDLDEIDTSPLKRGPSPKGDKHIKQIEDGRYEVIGTRDSKGRPYRYLRLAVARRRAREAYQDGLLHKTGDRVFVALNIKKLRLLYATWKILATLAEDVTHIDKSIVVRIGQNTHRLSRGSLGELATDLVIKTCGNCGGLTHHYYQGSKGPICTICRRTAPVLDVKRLADDA